MAKQNELQGVFDITLDLEDGASIGQETSQAQLFGSTIASKHNVFQRLGVRVHDPLHPHFAADIDLILQAAKQAPAYWMVPKITDLAQAKFAIQTITQGHAKHHIMQAPIHLLIETHGALRDVYEIAALPEVESLSFGLMDFVSAHHGTIPASAMTSPQQFEHPMVAYAKLAISRACAANGKIANHNVTTDYQTTGAAFADARRAREEFGYARMWSIHPNQIDEILQAFAPDETEVQLAADLLLKASAAKWGPISFDSKLHDRASFRHYWLVLERAHRIDRPIPESVAHWF
jgi:citrate lyase subunit beta/citryl-CoA lyase